MKARRSRVRYTTNFAEVMMNYLKWLGVTVLTVIVSFTMTLALFYLITLFVIFQPAF